MRHSFFWFWEKLLKIFNQFFLNLWASLLNRVSRVPRCQRSKSMPTSHFYVLACQHGNVSINVPTCQRRVNFSTWRVNVPKSVPIFQLCLPKDVPIFQLFFKRIGEWCIRWCLDTWSLKPYQFKTFDVVFNGASGINWTILPLVQNGVENIFFIYLILYSVCKKTYLEKHTSSTP